MKLVCKTNFTTLALLRETNLMRSLTVWLEDGYCNITVANHVLITIIRFVAKSYTHPWIDFANKLHLVAYAYKISFVAQIMLANQTRQQYRKPFAWEQEGSGKIIWKPYG